MPTKAELELRMKKLRAEQEVIVHRLLSFWGNRGHDIQVWIDESPRKYPARTYTEGTTKIHVPAFTATVPEIRSDLVNGKPPYRAKIGMAA